MGKSSRGYALAQAKLTVVAERGECLREGEAVSPAAGGLHMKHRIVSIDREPQALQRFFHEIRDEVVIVEHEGKPLCVLYPAARLAYLPEGELKEAEGAWDLPEDAARAIAGEGS
jgi:hypothetical protein